MRFKKTSIIIILLLAAQVKLDSQEYLNWDNGQHLKITTSDNFNNYSGLNTMDESGLDAQLMEASRFLSQATFGMKYQDILQVSNLDFEAWIDHQMMLEPNYLNELMWENWDRILEDHPRGFGRYLAELITDRQIAARAIKADSIAPPLTNAEVESEREKYIQTIIGPYTLHFNNAWWHTILTAKDQLRQRVAYALSQILVVSSQSELANEAEALCYYYDLLLKNAFGNYRDLLLDISYSPAMGLYLSYLNNPKTDPESNVHPDENFARELMQLFTIGLYELNQDGTRKLDASGRFIPSYNNSDIKQLARVFTGLGPGGLDERMEANGEIPWTTKAYFGQSFHTISKQTPMKMYQEHHDIGEKNLLNNLHLPEGQHGDEDIRMVIDFLFNHPNVGPFICRQLIQRMIKSNPSPEYIERVANVFNDNGEGTRGDLAAVVKAILLDEEARSCADMQSFNNGKLKEPLMRHIIISRMSDMRAYRKYDEYSFTSYDSAGIIKRNIEEEIDPLTETVDYWNNGFQNNVLYNQYALMSPSVFNFYQPDHQPVGDISSEQLVAPEYKIHDTRTAISYLNGIWNYVGNPWYNNLWVIWQERFARIEPDYQRYAQQYTWGLENYIHYLDIEFTNGKMSDHLRMTIRQFDEECPEWVSDEIKAKYIIYLVMISPDFTIDK